MRTVRNGEGARGAADLWILMILLLLAGITALGLYTWKLYQEVEELEQGGIAQTIQDLKLVRKLEAQILSLHRNAAPFLAKPEETAMLLTYFDKEARAAGIDGTKIKGMQPLPQLPPKNGYAEVAFKLQFQAITREQLAKFLFNVEDQRPFIKSKSIDLKLDEYHNVVEVFVTFAYYVR